MLDYEFQMKIYMLAFEKLTGMRAKETILFLKDGDERNVDFDFNRDKFLSEVTQRMELLKSRHRYS